MQQPDHKPIKNSGKITVKKPVLPSNSSAALDQLDLEDGTEYGDFILNGQNLIGQSFERVIIERAIFKLVRCSSLNLAKANLADMRFDTCDLSNAEWQDAKLTRCEIADCKITGLHVINAEIADVLMRGCTGDLVQFQGSAFKRVIFQNCQLRGADFRFTNLEGVIFQDCDLQEAEFYEAKLGGTDFRTSNIMGIKAHPTDLKGAIIDSDQAALLGRHFAKLLEMEVTG